LIALVILWYLEAVTAGSWRNKGKIRQ